MTTDLDARGRAASAAARESVARAAAAAVEATPRRPAPRWRPLVAAATVAVAAVWGATVRGGGEATVVETGPAGEATVPTAPPPPIEARPGGTERPIATGRAADGREWSLFIGGPSQDVCLELPVGDRTRSGVCGDRDPAKPLDAGRFRPLVMRDSRTPHFVFGRVPSGTAEVVVELAPPAVLRRGDVLTVGSDAASFYVVELAAGETPLAVIALRADGATSRYEVDG